MITLTIGGAPEFTDGELAVKEIEATLKKLGKKTKDIKVVYGFGDSKTAGQGGHFFAQQWAEANGVLYRSGNPKFHTEDGNYNPNAVKERNEILSKISDAMILFVKGNSTGGNSIVDAFAAQGIAIFRVEEQKEKRSLKETIPIYSKIAQWLLKNSVTLDVETTELSELTGDIVDIAIVNAENADVLYSSFIYTTRPVSPNAYVVNGITPEMLKGCPSIDFAWKQNIKKCLDNKVIVASNAKFDEGMLCFALVRRGIEPPKALWVCLQELYAKYSCQPRKGLKTERIARQLGIEPGTHRALSDAQAQASILKAMAKGTTPDLTI